MRVLATIIALCLAAQAVAQPIALPTAFTYQGQLTSSGVPASGLHDLRFRLYDSTSSTTQLGPTICLDNVNVTDGRFSAALDFGAQFAGTQPRFLEIEVRRDTILACNNLAGFTVLAPRQQITAAPRATSALAATTADSATVATALVRPDGTGSAVVNATNTGNVGIATAAPGARLHVADGDIIAGVLNREWMIHTRSSFGGDFLQITDADNGTFQFQRGLIVHENGSVGIGAVPDGTRKLFVNGQIGMVPTFRVKSIHGAAFMPDIAGRDTGTGGFGYYDVLGVRGYGIGNGVFVAPVELPDGCQVQRIDLTYADTRPTDFTLTFGRTSTTTGVVSTITSVSSSGQAAGIRVAGVDLVGFGIGNGSNVYWLSANLQSFGSELHQIVAVRITYTVTSPVP